MRLSELVQYLDQLLRTAEVPDSSRALNGLQVEGPEEVTRVAAAVDASEAVVQEALRRGCDLLLVHHGLFWDGGAPLTGRRFRRVAPLIRGGVAVYSSHLPLDVHPELGNNAVLARELGLEVAGRFGDYEGVPLGVWGRHATTREALGERLEQLLGGPVRLVAGGAERVERIGVITGSGASMIADAVAAGLDALVTGEGSHHTYFDAVELGINVYYGGHYATETWGVRALARHVGERFGLAWEFVDQPTGM